MLKPIHTKRFEKDIKKVQKQNKDISKLKSVINNLTNETSLESKYKNHKLKGNYIGRMECHIEPDWLLIYRIESPRIIFERTGSHSDLFK